jgi:hypothetical protein
MEVVVVVMNMVIKYHHIVFSIINNNNNNKSSVPTASGEIVALLPPFTSFPIHYLLSSNCSTL